MMGKDDGMSSGRVITYDDAVAAGELMPEGSVQERNGTTAKSTEDPSL